MKTWPLRVSPWGWLGLFAWTISQVSQSDTRVSVGVVMTLFCCHAFFAGSYGLRLIAKMLPTLVFALAFLWLLHSGLPQLLPMSLPQDGTESFARSISRVVAIVLCVLLGYACCRRVDFFAVAVRTRVPTPLIYAFLLAFSIFERIPNRVRDVVAVQTWRGADTTSMIGRIRAIALSVSALINSFLVEIDTATLVLVQKRVFSGGRKSSRVSALPTPADGLLCVFVAAATVILVKWTER